jgi:hypothetical protein
MSFVPLDPNFPIDINAVQQTADKMRGDIRMLTFASIREMLPNFRRINNVQSTKDILTFEAESIMMPYDPELTTPKKLGTIGKRTIAVYVGMSLVKDEVERYRDTYLVTMEDLALKSSPALPFAEWYVDAITLTGLQDMATLPWTGVKRAEAVADAICDGFLKIIFDEITASKITTALGNMYELAGSATDYTSSSIGTELLAQFNKFPKKVKAKGIDIHIPYGYKQMYRDWLNAEYPYIADPDQDVSFLAGSDKKGRFIWDENMGEDTKAVVMVQPWVLCFAVDRYNAEFGKLHIFHPNNNPYMIASTNKVALGFQLATLHKSAFIVNNLVADPSPAPPEEPIGD